MHLCLPRRLLAFGLVLLSMASESVGHGAPPPNPPAGRSGGGLPELQESTRRAVAARVSELEQAGRGTGRDALLREIAGIKQAAEAGFAGAMAGSPGSRNGLPLGTSSWPVNGLAVATGSPEQFAPRAVHDGAGGVYIAWWEGTGTSALFLMRLTWAGDPAPGWPAGGIAIPATSGGGLLGATPGHSLVADGSGGVYLSWEDASDSQPVRLLRVDGNGAIATGFPSGGIPVGGAFPDTRPQLLADGAGGVIVLWLRNVGSGEPWRLRAQRVDGTGGIAWTAGGVEVSGAPVAVVDSTSAFSVDGDGSGGALVGWITGSGSGMDVLVQRMTGSGSIADGWPAAGDTLCAAAGEQREVRVAGDGSGGGFAAWTDERVDGAPRIRVTRFDASGNTGPGWPGDGLQPVEDGATQVRPLPVYDGLGGVLVTWIEPDSGPGATARLRTHHLDGSGFLVWAEPFTVTSSFEPLPDAVVAVGDGAYGNVVGWTSGLPAAGSDIFCQYVDWYGKAGLPASGLAVSNAAGNEILRALARTEIGVVIAVFTADSGGSDTDIYAMRMATRSDLNAVVYPSGWTQAIVARNDTVSGPEDVTPTPTLDGNMPTTRLNWAYEQAGPNPMPAWGAELRLDEAPILSFEVPDSGSVGMSTVLDLGPVNVRGGRHSLAGVLDAEDGVPEANEGNNTWQAQYVWSPLPVSAGTPAVRSVPPPRGTTVYPNGDGFQFDRDPARAWVIAAACREPADDYDLYVYDDYSGSTSGFSSLQASSFLPSNLVEFVVGHGTGTPLTLYPMMVRFYADGASDFILDADHAGGRAGNPDGTGDFPAQVLAGNRLAHVYDAYLQSGATYTFILNRLSGPSDLELRIFPGYSGGIHDPFGAAATAAPLADLSDVLEYTATTTGWHPLLVSRADGADAGLAVGYELEWKPGTVGGIPDSGIPARLTLTGPEFNPLRGGGMIGFEIPRAAEVALTVYDVSGRRVKTLAAGPLEAGRHRVRWNGDGDGGTRVAPGIYILRLRAESASVSSRFVFLP